MKKDSLLMSTKMNLMSELSDRDFKEIAIKTLQQPITNSLKTNEKINILERNRNSEKRTTEDGRIETCNSTKKNLTGWSQYQGGNDRIESVNLRTD